MNMYSPVPLICLTPYGPFKFLEAVFDTMAADLFTVRPEHKRSTVSQKVSPEAIRMLEKAIRGVRPGRGCRATLAGTLTDAEMSGDHNPVHVDPLRASSRFGNRLIAHGMKSVTQAAAALMLELEGSNLVPESFDDIQFRDAVILDEDMVSFPRVIASENPLCRVVEVFAKSHAKKERLITRVSVSLREGNFEDGELEYYLLSGWHISAVLAGAWPGCLYRRQQLKFYTSARPNSTYVRVQGMSRDGMKVVVKTDSHAGGIIGEPLTTGEAVIILG